jgi:oligoendopeptidase F
MFHAPMAYAETASVFGETTMFNFLLEEARKTNDKEKIKALLTNKIEDEINTTVRQISFSNFERRIHGMDKEYKTWSEPRKNSVEDLNKIWMETTREFYGEEGEIFTYENMQHLWSDIPHFHSPFYVYSYAFGQLLSQSLYAQKDNFGDKFEPLYLDLLRAGGTKDAVELLKPFDLDPTKEQFWIDGINSGLGAMVSELEELLKD